ncbi:MAG: hypothetical protein JXR51_15235 [Bacteroidales bacterium]|nr:hypothetical protein [Bacteroidales bacterium]MBN2758525.1 hypothetical protein [Bacteroidales bacterium]
MARVSYKEEKLLRKHKLSFLFNDLEQDVLDNYCKKYNINNKSKFMREAIVKAILKQLDKDYPSLFPEFEEQNQPVYEQGTLAF